MTDSGFTNYTLFVVSDAILESKRVLQNMILGLRQNETEVVALLGYEAA